MEADMQPVFDESGICVEFRKYGSENGTEDRTLSFSQTRDFYFLLLILRGKGECQHEAAPLPLIPGGLIFCSPGQSCSFLFQENAAFCVLYFRKNVLRHNPESYFENLSPAADGDPFLVQKERITDMISSSGSTEGPEVCRGNETDSIPGLMLLSGKEADYIQSLYQQILSEQLNRSIGYESMKVLFLEEMLTMIRRIRLRKFDRDPAQVSWKRQMTDKAIQQIEGNLVSVSFEQIARQSGITLSYFRMIFREIVGMTPLEYLNRARILRALELLQTTGDSISNIASSVGIYDANYFSRMFRKIIGYPPTYYKSIK